MNKRSILFVCIVLIGFSQTGLGQTNPGFETGDLNGWIDIGTGTETISALNVRTGSYVLSYATNNSSSQRFENTSTFSVPNDSYLHCIGWATGSNADSRAGITIFNGAGWNGASIITIGTTLTRLTHTRQNISGSTVTTFQIGLNSLKVANATILYWDDIVAYVSTSSTTDLTAPSSATNIQTNSNLTGTTTTVSWTDGTDASTGSQRSLILRADGLNQIPPSLNDQAQYSVGNTVGSWTIVGIVNVGTQTFDDNTTIANTDYTYAVYMTDLAFNYSVGSSNSFSTLPVELTSFSASVRGNAVTLAWKTATEVDNYGFEIERTPLFPPFDKGGTKGGSAFSKGGTKRGSAVVGFVNGAGNSNSPQQYRFVDKSLPVGTYLYRLKQIDNDGKYTYSSEVEATIAIPAVYSLEQNYPNPFNPTTRIQYSVAGSQNVTVKIFNVLGKEVAVLVDEKKEPGVYSVEYNASHLASGLYLYRLQAGDVVLVKKMVVLK